MVSNKKDWIFEKIIVAGQYAVPRYLYDALNAISSFDECHKFLQEAYGREFCVVRCGRKIFLYPYKKICGIRCGYLPYEMLRLKNC